MRDKKIHETPAGDDKDEETVALGALLGFIKLGDEPIMGDVAWKHRVHEIVAGLPADMQRDILERLRQAQSNGRLPDIDAFADRHGLTPAETGLVRSLADGLSVSKHAGAKHISVNTARFQMQRVLEKTGARRQVDLIRMLLG